jgi:kynurenine formamidase
MRVLFYTGCVIALAAIVSAQPGRTVSPATTTNDTRTTPEEFRSWMKTLNNWGRWGSSDELGAANLITPAKRKAAAAEVKTGEMVSLAHQWLAEKAADVPMPYRLLPRVLVGANEYALDREELDFHGFATTHVDSLCHVGYEGQLYNGRSFTATASEKDGCVQLGILNVKDRLITRGVLLDIPRLKGVEYLEPGTHIYREDIEAWEKKTGTKIEPGDAILVRTGRWARRAKMGPTGVFAGLDVSVLPLLKQRDIALMGHDAAHDVNHFAGLASPIHQFALVALGAHLFDNVDLETLSATAARLNRWSFLFIAAPNPVPNGTGSPINPLAMF